MQRPKTPYQELTDQENINILGTLTWDGWGALAVARGRADYFDNEIGRQLLDRLMMTSGSIRGEHRKDLVSAIQGQKAPRMGLTFTPDAPPPEANGHVKKVAI